jgi:ammonia channel protein AmtB
LYGIGVSIAWSAFASYLLLKIIDATLGLRVGINEELLVSLSL